MPGAVTVLAQFAASDSPLEKAAARQALLNLRRGRVAETMVRQMATSRPAVQGELARALGERGDQAALSSCSTWLRRDRNQRVTLRSKP